MTAKQTKATSIASDVYRKKYGQNHPLLQGRVPIALYREAQRRARAVDFSVSKWLSYWLRLTFKSHPMVKP